MKHIIFGVFATLVIILVLMGNITIEGSAMRNRDLKNALHSSLEQALRDSVSKENYSATDNELLLADALFLLTRQLNANDKGMSLEVDVVDVDAEKGLICVHATETYTGINGRPGKAEDSATVVLEREIPKQRYDITYTLPEDIQKELLLPETVRSYCIEERSPIKIPDTPSAIDKKGWSIKAWKDKKTNTNYTSAELSSMKASKDLSFEAVVQK